MEIGGGTLCVYYSKGALNQVPKLRVWIDRSARIVAQYYGQFPVRQVQLKIRGVAGTDVDGGRTTNDPLRIEVSVGNDVSPDALTQDWVLVHEMVHLAVPDIGYRHDWLAEGLATYVEGVARAQAGNRSVEDVWAEARRAMPAGLPKPGEGGMDQTWTWGRMYWGGALFCLKADIAIRQQTGNRLGLQDALRAIDHETGGYGVERSIVGVLRIGDAATGTRVLEQSYGEVRTTPQMTDLDAMWKQLGVPDDPLHQPFDSLAPLAAIRTAITHKPNLD